ncbi:hypothetical protein, partial [Desulfurococcus mucosus]|uniref:hypothetical protein n=1 Tax=Desulfurococcus mucosus TaxID=2275 RepID=UPI00064E9725
MLSPRIIVLTLLLTALTLLPAMVVAQASSSVLLNTSGRNWTVSGQLQVKVIQGGSIDLSSSGVIYVKEGDTVVFNINDANGSGKMWIGSDGYLDIKRLWVDSIYVNG